MAHAFLNIAKAFAGTAKRFPITTVYLSGCTVTTAGMVGYSFHESLSKDDTPFDFTCKFSKVLFFTPLFAVGSFYWPIAAGKTMFDMATGRYSSK